MGEKNDEEMIKFVQDIIKTNYIVIFSKTSCMYCKFVKEEFESLNAKYMPIELDLRPDGSGIQDALEKLTGGRTVPKVFIDGNYVGGAEDIDKLHREGDLEKLLIKKYETEKDKNETEKK